jgi:hypothetical protein
MSGKGSPDREYSGEWTALINSDVIFRQGICWGMDSPNKLGRYVFATVLNSRINSWETWFICNLRKVNINQYCNSIHGYRIIMTCMNDHLLGAPRKYVLHGLDPGLD